MGPLFFLVSSSILLHVLLSRKDSRWDKIRIDLPDDTSMIFSPNQTIYYDQKVM